MAKLDKAVSVADERAAAANTAAVQARATGDPQFNLELSRKRAAAVVRFLTLDKKIQLFRMQTLGYAATTRPAMAARKTGESRSDCTRRRWLVKSGQAVVFGHRKYKIIRLSDLPTIR